MLLEQHRLGMKGLQRSSVGTKNVALENGSQLQKKTTTTIGHPIVIHTAAQGDILSRA